ENRERDMNLLEQIPQRKQSMIRDRKKAECLSGDHEPLGLARLKGQDLVPSPRIASCNYQVHRANDRRARLRCLLADLKNISDISQFSGPIEKSWGMTGPERSENAEKPDGLGWS